MGRFKIGQKVTYLRLGKVGTIVKVNAGLGYYLDCSGWIYSAPEDALSAMLPKRYQKDRKKDPVQSPQTGKANDFAESTPVKSTQLGLRRESEEVPGGAGQKPGEDPKEMQRTDIGKDLLINSRKERKVS